MFEQIPETAYGMRKRIQFIYGEIEKRIGKIDKDKRGIKILDVGCGTGELITIPLGFLGVNILGIDINLPSIEYAKGKNPFENVTFECTSVKELADSQFDFIICSEVLEHLKNPSDMLQEIKGKLKENGICIITIPNGYCPKEIEVRLYNMLYTLACRLRLTVLLNLSERYLNKTLRDSLNTESPHIQLFSLKKFKSLLDRCGFSIIRMGNRRFLSGFFSNIILSKFETLSNWNVEVANRLPYFLVSSWMFVVKHREADEE